MELRDDCSVVLAAHEVRVAFVPIVTFLVAVVFFSILLVFIWLFSKEDIGGYRVISGS